MYPNIYAQYPILEKLGYLEAVKLKKKVQKMEKKKKNTVTIAENNPSRSKDASSKESKEEKVPVWRTSRKTTPIPEMDDDFLRKAYFHSLKMIGQHSSEIMKHENSLNTFMDLNGHLADEAMKRGLGWIERAKEKQETA